MLSLTKTFSDILKKTESLNWRQVVKIEQTAGAHVNAVSNPGFENSTGANFDDWTEAGSGAIAAETTLQHSGSQCVKLTYDGNDKYLDQNITVVAGTNRILSFFTRGDGSYDGNYRIYDVTNGADIVAQVATGVTGTDWVQIVVEYTTPALCVTVMIRFISNTANNSDVYFDDIHDQLASEYYYYSGEYFEIEDLKETTVPVLGLLKNDIETVQQLDWREHIASVGGFTLNLINEGIADAWNTNTIANRAIWIYIGIGDLSYLRDYLLLYKGICKDYTIQNNIISLEVENSSFISQKEIPDFVSDSNAAAGQGGILPDESKGKVKPIVFGNHFYDFMRDTEATGDGSTNIYDRANNMTPCIFLGLDQVGYEHWLVAGHQIDTITQANRCFWAFDPSLNRMVEIGSTVFIQQNTASGCIVKFPVNPTFYDYWLPDGSNSNQDTENGDDGLGEINDPENMVDLDNDTFGDLTVQNATTGAVPYATLDLDFGTYKNAGTLSACNVYALANMSTAQGNATITINSQDASGAAGTFVQYGTSTASEAGIAASITCIITGETLDVGQSTNVLDIYMIYKRVSYKANNRLQLFAGGKGREYSGTWNSRKTSGNLIETPTDIIESICRDDLGLGDDDINMDSFDAVNTELTASFIFSGAILERINTKVLFDSLAKQCNSFNFWDANDTVKMDTFYASNTTNRIFDKNEVGEIPIVYKSPLSNIINQLNVNYFKNYNTSKFQSQLSRIDDRASVGSQAVYNAIMTLDLDNDFIRDDTAIGLFANHWAKTDNDSFWSVLIDIVEIQVSCNRGIDFWDTGVFKPTFLLELGDIFELDDADFDNIVLCNGVSWDGLQFKIFYIKRMKNGLYLKGFGV